ncbi:MAG TPA: ATP synthase F1 subunit gamma [Holophagaceae bacterium]|jgi:F-type H+-transporting ATPase subunit gamma|nr:ATP synthase F1 subunit gamma [Holophagaceae bacterium]
MASLQDIRRRVRSVKNTQQVTKALKMISAVKLRKSQERLAAMRPYAAKLQDMALSVVSAVQGGDDAEFGPIAMAFTSPRAEKAIRVVAVASDKGLCGGFNANIFKKLQAFLRSKEGVKVTVDAVGRRVNDWARKQGIKPSSEHIGVPLPGLDRVAYELADEAAQQYINGEIDALYVVYNHFHSAMSQEPTVLRVFPVDLPPAESRPFQVAPLLEPDANTILERLLPRYLEVTLLRGLLESSASEHGARMASMDKASNNAGEMISKLTLTMNKIRQAAITNQIIEIVSGANA